MYNNTVHTLTLSECVQSLKLKLFCAFNPIYLMYIDSVFSSGLPGSSYFGSHQTMNTKVTKLVDNYLPQNGRHTSLIFISKFMYVRRIKLFYLKLRFFKRRL
jgi:hypothetical protein